MGDEARSLTNSVLIGVLMLIIGAGFTWMFSQRANTRQDARDKKAEEKEKAADLASRHAELVKQVAELQEKLSLVSAQVVPLSTAFTQVLVAQLTHMHTPELDALLAKIGPPCTLTDAEEVHMYALLKERQHDMGDLITQEEREAALILPYVLKRARTEQAQIAVAEGVKLKLVGVTALIAVSAAAMDAAIEKTKGA